MTRDEVHALFGPPEKVIRGHRESFLGSFFVDFDVEGRVKFIEMGHSPRFRALFDGVCLHECQARKAIGTVSVHDGYDEAQAATGRTYVFLGLQLSLWRGGKTGSFEAVGIARDGYFKKELKDQAAPRPRDK
jgi:hypothetical protein